MIRTSPNRFLEKEKREKKQVTNETFLFIPRRRITVFICGIMDKKGSLATVDESSTLDQLQSPHFLVKTDLGIPSKRDLFGNL